MSCVELVGFCIAFVLLLALSAFFSGSETALLSLSPAQVQRIREQRSALGEQLSRLLAEPEVLLSTILIGNTFVNAALASVGYSFVVRSGWVSAQAAEAASIVAVTALVLLFGEISPKQFAIQHAEGVMPLIVRVMRVAIPLFRPLTWCLQRLLKPLRKTLVPERRAVSDEELVSVVNLGQERGALDREEGAMVRGILRLSDLNASDVMTPRVDLIGLDVHDSPAEHEQQMRSAPFVWMPLWDETPDNFIDFVDVQRYLLDPSHDLEAARCHCTQAVPENICLDDLLVMLYRQHLPMVLVSDEYGGTAGIVSRGDILELLSLETEDEPGAAEAADVRSVGPNMWIVAGDAALEQINFELGTHLEADDADRMSGWVTFHAGRIPRVGERVEADGYRVRVEKMRRRKILSVRLEDLDPASQDPDLPREEEAEGHLTTGEGDAEGGPLA